MQPSDSEKLIIVMLAEIQKHLKICGEIDPDFVEDALFGGHYWAFKWQYSGLFHDHTDQDDSVKEVVDILDMWSFLEEAYERLSPEDKTKLEKEGDPFGKNIKFVGFDGNNEAEHRSIALFLIRKLQRFGNFSGRELNSHMPSLEIHRRMLRAFLPIRARLVDRSLTVDNMIEIVRARIHPENRI